MPAPVGDPGLAEHLATEAAGGVPVVPGLGAVLGDAAEGVGAGAGRDDGHAAPQGGVEARERVCVPGTEAQTQHERVRGVEGLGTTEGLLTVGIDHAVIVGEEDGAPEAVLLREDAGKHGHRLLGPVFLVAREEDDVLAGSRPLAGGELEPARTGRESGGAQRSRASEERERGERQQKGSAFHGVNAKMPRPRAFFKRPVRALQRPRDRGSGRSTRRRPSE